jgi:hypothetical protein
MLRTVFHACKIAVKPATLASQVRSMTTESGRTYTLRHVDRRDKSVQGSLEGIHKHLQTLCEKEQMEYEIDGLNPLPLPYPFVLGKSLSIVQINQQRNRLAQVALFPLTTQDDLVTDVTRTHDANQATPEQFHTLVQRTQTAYFEQLPLPNDL